MKYIIILWIVFLPVFSFAQLASPEISFIKLTNDIGYILDSVENKECNCITYVGKKEFQYAALIQFPDSHVVLRIKRLKHDVFTDVQMTEADVSSLYASALTINQSSSERDSSKEMLMFKTISGDSTIYHFLKYEELMFPVKINASTLQEHNKSVVTHMYFQAGIGAGTHFSSGMELGFAFKNKTISVRNFKVYELDPLFEDIEPNNTISDFGALFGWTTDQDKIVLSASVGISYVYGIVRGEFLYSNYFGTLHTVNAYKALTFQTIGLPIQGEIFLGAKRNFNISVVMFGNINAKYSFGGIILCLRVGSVK